MYTFAGLAMLGSASAVALHTITTTITTVSQPAYFQTTPELFAMSTATGAEPFMAETNPAPAFSGTPVSYIPPKPIETQEPIIGASAGENIFQLMGNIGPYHPSPGFGVNEYPLPKGSEISWLNMLARHGSRYPTDPITLATEIPAARAQGANFTGELEFLNDWEYKLGINILVPIGRQELYDSGVLHAYSYGHLFDPNSTKKLVARTTTQDRMRKSAENFLTGFFDVGWDEFAKLEVIIDEPGFNNSLAGYNACPDFRTTAGANASAEWISEYTGEIAQRLNGMSTGFTWNSTWVYAAMQLCPYETIGLGYSQFCDLFTYQEWEYFEYSIDVDFAGTFAFQSPTSRAVGIGYVEELLARINHHLITKATGSDNITLDSMISTFPINQVLNFDFTHEVNLMSVLTALGLKQFAPFFPATTYVQDRALFISHLVPFGCRLDIEIIETPHPVNADRPSSGTQYAEGGPTKYIHMLLNQRTIPLGESYAECGLRADGWCELETWLGTQMDAMQQANYDYACNGDYPPPAYGAISNGAIYQNSSSS